MIRSLKIFKKGCNLNRSLVRYLASSSSNEQETVKKFKSSFDLNTPSSVVSEEVSRPKKSSYNEILMDKIKADKEANTKVRKLNKLDKIILVKLGKYKKIEDVPDEIKYKSNAVLEKDKRDIRSFMEDKGFKAFISVDYFLMVCCVFFIGVAGYFYRKKQIYEKSLLTETTSSSEL